MGYNELLEKYNLLLDENNRLIKENSYLKTQLGQTKPELSKNIASAIKTEKNQLDNKITDANHVSDVNSASDSLAKSIYSCRFSKAVMMSTRNDGRISVKNHAVMLPFV